MWFHDDTKVTPRQLTGTAAVGALVILCVVFVDRPTARWFDTTFHSSPVRDIAAGMFSLIHQSLRVAGAVIVVVSVWLLLSREGVSKWRGRILAGSVATVVSLAITVALKFIVGRSQVDPAFLRDGVYTIRPFTLGPDYGAFPSATAAVATALIIALQLPPRVERLLLIIVLSLLTAALLVTGGHWLSDIIGGIWLGIVLGRFVSRRFRSAESAA